jgi:midasin (ATPase involved in ribosome maturation)
MTKPKAKTTKATKTPEAKTPEEPKLAMKGNRPVVQVPIGSLFPNFGGPEYTYEEEFTIWENKGVLTPSANDYYVFPEQQTLDFLCLHEKENRNNIYVCGWSGTGKTEMVRNLMSKINGDLLELNADAFLTRGDLIGRWIVKDNETQFVYGVLPTAMTYNNGRGCTLLINEFDTISPLVANILKPVLEDDPRITILENGAEVVRAGPDFRVVVTANTWARGDDSGMFTNTHVQSVADQRRFHGFIQLDYLTPEVETEILKKYFPKLDDKCIANFIKVGNKIRESFKAGKIGRTFSPAELVNWAENYGFCSSAHHAARLSFLTAYEPEAKVAVEEMINSVWGHEATDE